MTLFQSAMVAALLAGGMGVALLGSVKVPLAKRLQIDEARVGGLVSLFGFTLIPVILGAGFLTDLVGRQVVLVGGSILLAASLGMLAGARSYPAALGAVIFLSTGWALVINVGNVLTPLAFRGNLTYATNLANVFFGVGAFLTPLGVAFLLRRTTFGAALSLLGVLALLPGLLALGVDFAALTPPAGQADAASAAEVLLRNPYLWLCGLALFFYGPLEASVGAWATTYLGEQGVREGAASGLLSGFWLAFMGTRLATALTVSALAAGGALLTDWEPRLVLVLGLLCVGVLAGMVVGRGPAAGGALVLGAGLVFGPIFPTILAILLGHVAAALHGRAVGMLFAIGGLGWSVIPILIGAYARRAGVRRAFAVAVGAAIGLSGVAAALVARTMK